MKKTIMYCQKCKHKFLETDMLPINIYDACPYCYTNHNIINITDKFYNLLSIGYFTSEHFGKITFTADYCHHNNSIYWINSLSVYPTILTKQEYNTRLKFIKKNNPDYKITKVGKP